jgi:putative endonuclease
MYYTGHTANLQRRLLEHKGGKTPFMKKGMPWIVIYSSDFPSRSEAMALEASIKKRGAKRFLEDINISVD